MNAKLGSSIEKIAHAAKDSNQAAIEKAVKEAREQLKQPLAAAAGDAKKLLAQLDAELEIWQNKIGVIVKEPVARQGMAKHAHHWTEVLKKAGS